MNKTRSFFLSLLLLGVLAMIPSSVFAFELQKSSSFLVEAGKKIDKNVYAFSDNVTIEGEVDGDVFCIADNLIIMGYVDGDVICLAKNINIQGEITGNLRALVGGPVSINGKIGKNATIISESLYMPKLSSIDKDLLAISRDAQIDGLIGRDFEGAFSTVSISGHITGDVNLSFDDPQITEAISVGDQAYIGGRLNYEAPYERIKISDEAYINSGVKYEFKEKTIKKKKVFGFTWFYSLFACLIISVLISLLFKKRLQKVISIMTSDYKKSFAWGALVFFLAPALLVVMMATIIGIPFALILGFAWFLFLMITRIIAGIWLGQLILKKLKWQEDNLILASVIGVIVAKLLFTILILGWILNFSAIIWVLGACWLYFKNKKEDDKHQQKKSSKK